MGYLGLDLSYVRSKGFYVFPKSGKIDLNNFQVYLENFVIRSQIFILGFGLCIYCCLELTTLQRVLGATMVKFKSIKSVCDRNVGFRSRQDPGFESGTCEEVGGNNLFTFEIIELTSFTKQHCKEVV